MINGLISIIIPNYNCEKYIEECLNSLKGQTYKKIEIIVIDDGSTDDSVNIIKGFIESNKSMNIKLIQQMNQNAAVARNRGLEVANGEFMYFIDSDDRMFEETSLEKMVNSIGECDLLIGNYKKIYEHENKKNEFFSNRECNNLEDYSMLAPLPSNKLYRSNVIKKHNIYFSNVRIGQDLNFYLKYLLFSPKIKIINDVIYEYRILNTSMSRAKNLNFMDINTSLNEVRKYYINNDKGELFEKQLSYVCIRHFITQLGKVSGYKKIGTKKMLLNYFDFCIKSFLPVKCKKNIKQELRKYKIKKVLILLDLYKKKI